MTTRWMITAACGVGLALGGCNGGGAAGNGSSGAASTAPVKRQPGSWKSKIDIVKLEGKGVQPGMKEQMQQMFNMVGAMSVCITPEAAAKEDVSKRLEDSAGSKNCTFDKKNISGETVEFSGICQDRQGQKIRMSATGKNSATAQDITMKIEPLGAGDASEGVMEMHVTSERSGDCKPGDITPPAENAN